MRAGKLTFDIDNTSVEDIRQAVMDGLFDVAMGISDQASANAPVRTGALRDSMVVEKTAGGATITADTGYSSYVELGTSKMRAQPYLRPALVDADLSPLEGLV